MEHPEAPDANLRQAPLPNGARESVWSVRRKHADTFFATLYTLWSALAIIIVAFYVKDQVKLPGMNTAEWITRSAPDILPELGAATLPIVLISMAANRPLTTAGGAIVITYEAMRQRWVTPVIQRHEARGRAEGEARANKQWIEWWNRRQEAEANGLPFDEPPPSES